MFDVLEIIISFIDAVAVLMALVLMLSLVHRSSRGSVLNSLIMGGMFSVAIVSSMTNPIVLPHGSGFFDMRMLLVGTASGLFGPFVGVLALSAAAVYRFLIGGPGTVTGIVCVFIAFGTGLIWHYYIRNRKTVAWKKSLILGGMLSFQVLAIFSMPADMWAMLFRNLAPYLVVTSLLGSLIINHLLSGELSFLSEAEASKIDAHTDHLTGLVNRRGLELIYPSFVQSTDTSKGQALLYFDIDRFKKTNDNFGHAVGDDVLRHVADQVAANLRKNDTFVRLGGDEFVVILPEIDAAEAQAIGERCRCMVASSGFEADCQIVPISISVGAVWAKTPTKIERLLDAADKALYRAKEKGRNTVVFEDDGQLGGAQAA